MFLCFLSTWRTFLHMYTVYTCPFGPQYNPVGHSLTWYQRARFSHLQTNPASVHRAASAPSRRPPHARAARDFASAVCSRASSRAGRRPLASPRVGRRPRARASGPSSLLAHVLSRRPPPARVPSRRPTSARARPTPPRPLPSLARVHAPAISQAGFLS